MSTSTSRARAGGYGYNFPHEKFHDDLRMRMQAEERGTWQPVRKAQPTAYRWQAGDQFHVLDKQDVLCVEVVRRKYLPDGQPGYVIRNSWGIEIERSENALAAQHEAATRFLRTISLQREGSHPVPQGSKQRDCTSAIAWHFQLVLSGHRPGPGSRHRQ